VSSRCLAGRVSPVLHSRSVFADARARTMQDGSLVGRSSGTGTASWSPRPGIAAP